MATPRLGSIARRLAALLSTVLLGCALTAPPLASPKQGGAAWSVLQSDRFDLTTDLSPDDARGALTALEGMYDLFVDVAIPRAKARAGRIEVILFRREEDYRVVGKKGTDAYFTPALANDLEPAPTAVLYGGLTDENRLLFQHELCHYFLRRTLPNLPTWLNEGMAEVFSTLYVEDGEVFVGKIPPRLAFTTASDWQYAPAGLGAYAVPIEAVPSIRDLVTMPPEAFYAASNSLGEEPTPGELHRQRANYAGAWALVHMLKNGTDTHRAAFAAYLDLLARGTQPADAWASTVGQLDARLLELAFREYLHESRLKMRARPYTPRPAPPLRATNPLSDADVNVLFARLDDWSSPAGSARAEAHLDLALASAEWPDLHFWRALFYARRKGATGRAAEEIALALGANPKEPRYLLAQLEIESLRVTTQSPGAVPAIAAALGRVAESAAELIAVARTWAVLRRAADALPFAERALAKEPDAWSSLDTYATILAALGRTDEARRAAERALELAPEGVRTTDLRARLQALRAAAGQPRRP